jgi:hypothetical protein
MKTLKISLLLLFILIACKKGPIPEVTTAEITLIRCATARSGGEIVNDGGSKIVDRGVCWSISENPTLSNSYASAGSGLGKYMTILTGLESNSNYYVRAYAKNSEGTAYGNSVSFTTCLNINSNPVNPLTTTLYDKTLDTIKKYIRGKWRIVVVRGGMAGIDFCYNNYYAEFTADDKFITNAFRTTTETYLIDWVKRYNKYYGPDSSYRMELKTINGGNVVERYFVEEIINDSLIYNDTMSDPLFYYGIKEK